MNRKRTYYNARAIAEERRSHERALRTEDAKTTRPLGEMSASAEASRTAMHAKTDDRRADRKAERQRKRKARK